MPTTDSRRKSVKALGQSPLTLTKWYFDCVAENGRVAIGDWASLAWRGLEVTWQSLALHSLDQPPANRSSLVPAPPPQVAAGEIRWGAPALGSAIEVEPRQAPIESRLIDDGTGVVEWRSEAPAARVSVEIDGAQRLEGAGCAERIRITVPPWRLPIRELRWGRWLDPAASRSVVWIDWRGGAMRTWAFVDGTRVPAVVSDRSVCSPGMSLMLGERRTLQSQALSEVVATIPPLQAAMPKSLLALRQTRWLTQGTLRVGNEAALAGSAIHEVVVFR